MSVEKIVIKDNKSNSRITGFTRKDSTGCSLDNNLVFIPQRCNIEVVARMQTIQVFNSLLNALSFGKNKLFEFISSRLQENI